MGYKMNIISEYNIKRNKLNSVCAKYKLLDKNLTFIEDDIDILRIEIEALEIMLSLEKADCARARLA